MSPRPKRLTSDGGEYVSMNEFTKYQLPRRGGTSSSTLPTSSGTPESAAETAVVVFAIR